MLVPWLLQLLLFALFLWGMLNCSQISQTVLSIFRVWKVRSIAINELGMKYAKEGQVVTYSSEGNDFVRQYSDIPNTVNK